MGRGGFVEGNVRVIRRIALPDNELVAAAIHCPRSNASIDLRFWPSRSGSDHRVPEEHSKKTNHKNAKDKAPRVATEGLVVVRAQPVGIAHAKLLGRPPASQPHQTLIKIS